MAHVEALGGLFFRARDPQALAEWYARHLGVTPAPQTMEAPVWRQAEGPTIFAPFPEGSDYFPADKQFMLNFRVRDLDGLVQKLRDAGIAVEDQPPHPAGRFARLEDPEGTPIELWEPGAG